MHAKLFFRNFLVLLCSFIISIKAQCGLLSTLAQGACEDCFSWCPSQVELCGRNQIIKESCRKTCANCPIKDPECLELNCAQRCIPRQTMFAPAQCACFAGFGLDSDGRTCNDINECEIEPEQCVNVENRTQCINLPGSSTCGGCQALNRTKYLNYYERSECCLRNQGSECGRSSTNSGQIGGNFDAPALAWPWQVYLQIFENACGGSLISDRHILTAANCVQSVASKPSEILIITGTSNIGDANNVHTQTHRAVKVTVHPAYTFPDNDIAIVELNTSIVSSRYVSPVCLPNDENPSDGEVCYATGYGAVTESGTVSRELQQLALPIVPISVCTQAYENHTYNVKSELHLCAGFTDDGKDACSGNTGGPLVCQRRANCDWYVAGVIAFGRGCGRPGYYGVYTNVTHYESWINQITNAIDQKPQGEGIRGSWLEWAAWTQCSVSCGTGERQRIRACSSELTNVTGCVGESTQVGDCIATSGCSGSASSLTIPIAIAITVIIVSAIIAVVVCVFKRIGAKKYHQRQSSTRSTGSGIYETVAPALPFRPPEVTPQYELPEENETLPVDEAGYTKLDNHKDELANNEHGYLRPTRILENMDSKDKSNYANNAAAAQPQNTVKKEDNKNLLIEETGYIKLDNHKDRLVENENGYMLLELKLEEKELSEHENYTTSKITGLPKHIIENVNTADIQGEEDGYIDAQSSPMLKDASTSAHQREQIIEAEYQTNLGSTITHEVQSEMKVEEKDVHGDNQKTLSSSDKNDVRIRTESLTSKTITAAQ